MAQFPDAGQADVPASIRKLEAETDRHIGALGDRKMKEKTLKESPQPVLYAERPQERRSP